MPHQSKEHDLHEAYTKEDHGSILEICDQTYVSVCLINCLVKSVSMIWSINVPDEDIYELIKNLRNGKTTAHMTPLVNDEENTKGDMDITKLLELHTSVQKFCYKYKINLSIYSEQSFVDARGKVTPEIGLVKHYTIDESYPTAGIMLVNSRANSSSNHWVTYMNADEAKAIARELALAVARELALAIARELTELNLRAYQRALKYVKNMNALKAQDAHAHNTEEVYPYTRTSTLCLPATAHVQCNSLVYKQHMSIVCPWMR